MTKQNTLAEQKVGNIFASLSVIKQVFPRWMKIRTVVLILSLLFNSLLELFGIAIIIPVTNLLLNERFLHENKYASLLYNNLGFTSTTKFVLFVLSGLIGVIILKNIIATLVYRYQMQFVFTIFQYYSSALLKYYYSKGFLFFKRTNSNVIVRDIFNNALFFSQFYLVPLLTMIGEIMVASFILIGILYYDALSILILFISVIPPTVVFYRMIRKRIQWYGDKKNSMHVDMISSLYQTIQGYTDVKVNNKEAYFFEQYRRQVNEMLTLQTKSFTYVSMPPRVIEVSIFLAFSVIIMVGYFLEGNKENLIQMLTLIGLAAYRIVPSINRIMAALLGMRANLFTVNVIAQIPPEQNWEEYYQQNAPVSPMPFQKQVTIKDIDFAYYEGQNILSDFNIALKKGESLGVIGRSGSGKSTLINLMLSFITPSKGQILVDDVVITPENDDNFRRIVGYVQQDVFILDTSLAENIAFGVDKKNIDYEKLNRVIEQASLTEVVAKLEKGVHTRLGERGTQLSGGQKQRVGIARALYSDVSILVFDEATSSLDTQTEEEITEAIRKLADGNLTMLIVAHRYSTLKYCNRIVELEKGKIKGEFTYQEVLSRIVS